jgi:hypothetical protein
MKDELRSMNKSAFAELRRAKSAVAVAGWPKRAVMKAVKTVKSVLAVFHLEAAAAQSVPTKIGRGDFTAFALILRLGMGGRGSAFPVPRRDKGVNYEN